MNNFLYPGTLFSLGGTGTLILGVFLVCCFLYVRKNSRLMTGFDSSEHEPEVSPHGYSLRMRKLASSL